MRLKLFLLLMLAAALPALAQKATVSGVVVDANTGAPIKGVTVAVQGQNVSTTTSPSGSFQISNANPGDQIINFMAPGYNQRGLAVQLTANQVYRMESVQLESENYGGDLSYNYDEMYFDEVVLDDEAGSAQSINALTGASDDIYFSTSGYNFGPMYFNYRGYDSRYQSTYINGVKFNDLIRGRFNYSSLLGMTSRAFRNKTTTVGLGAAAYGFGNIGGSSNFNTITSGYAPGLNASLAYTNSAYMLRGMLTYSTGINKDGWGLTVCAIGRYAPQGVIEGTFYNSGGLFLSLEKEFNIHHSLTLTAWGGPTQRAAARATYQEAYDLAGSNLYNPNWGWQDGKKRSSSIRNSFDPTAMLTWLYKSDHTVLNTSAAIRWVNYSSSALSYFNAANPDPTYYRNLPSFWATDYPEIAEELAAAWHNDPSVRQINWDRLYEVNNLTNILNQSLPEDQKEGANYILEDRHSNQFNAMLNSYIDQRLTDHLSLQAGVSFNYTNASFYKTVRDLLGGEFWLDVDNFSRDQEALFPDQDRWQNDLNNPNFHAVKGDRFGYDYNIYAIQAQGWLQNTITLPKWDVDYGVTISYTQYQRDGHMKNGRAPENSFGKGDVARFNDAMAKAGATYKLNGRNFFRANVSYGTMAPLADNIYVSPRTKGDLIANPKSENIFTGDLSYIWSYPRFRGSITGFYTVVNNATEHTLFYDDAIGTNANFVLTDVKRCYKGVELGMSYKILPSLAATFAGTYARYQYKNNPTGIRSYENGMTDDIEGTVYLKNYFLGSSPQFATNLGLDWQAPKNWFINLNGTYAGDSYVNVGIPYHEKFTDLWQSYPDPAEMEAKIKELTTQEKLKNAFTLNLSIGKFMYINRKYQLNFNLSVFNLLNNRNIVTYAYQQSRLRTNASSRPWDRDYYASRYSYAQGARVMFNVGFRF